MGTKATRSEWLQWVKDEARTFRQGSRGDVGLAPTGISHTHPQRRCFGGGFGLLLGVFHGVPTTKKSIFDLPSGPDHIVLYQKNIESVCSNEAEVREQIRLTVIHELGHYFGLDEEQLKDV
jgi:Zincin-like metallopeptidase